MTSTTDGVTRISRLQGVSSVPLGRDSSRPVRCCPFRGAMHCAPTEVKSTAKEHDLLAKQLQFNAKARYSIRKGVNILANAVRVTIGPKGRNVVLDHPLDAPQVLNDGVTIARGIDLEDPFTNMVVQLLKEVTIKTNDIAGDGTTTAILLSQALLIEGLRHIAAWAHPAVV